jgi:hypothetical protein
VSAAANATASAAAAAGVEPSGILGYYADLARVPSATSSLITAVTAATAVTTTCRQQLLFRGPRTKAVVDFGGVTTEICRTTGRLLYRGRLTKNVLKLMDTARWGQVLCTAAVYAQAAALAPACGIALAPIASGGGGGGAGGRRKPGAFARTGSTTAPPPISETDGSGWPLPVSAVESTTDAAGAAAVVAAKKAQHYLCSLTLPHGVAPPALAPGPAAQWAPRRELKPPPAPAPAPAPAPGSGVRGELRPLDGMGRRLRSQPDLQAP